MGRRASRLNGCEIDGVDRASGMWGIGADETSLELKVGLCGECLATHLCIGSCKLGMVMLQWIGEWCYYTRLILGFSWLMWLAFTLSDLV